jgi:hypothetical protein
VTAPTREDIRRAIARHVRNDLVVRVTEKDWATDASPTHARTTDNTLLLRLSPDEADTASTAAVDALEELGVIPARPVSRRDLAHNVEAALRDVGHLEEGDADFGWKRWRPADDGPHVLVTCEVAEDWKTMPGTAVRTAIARHITAWAETLTTAGLGVSVWSRGDQPHALIVAADQATAEQQAAIVAPKLAALNPPR